MDTAALHLSAIELEQGLAEVLASPKDIGRLDAIFVRPAANERRALAEAQVSIEAGIKGDRWVRDGFSRLDDGTPDPRCQISLMNARILRQIAGDADAMCLAGDNLIVDLDLSEENLPTGSRLAIGNSVVIEFSDVPHTGCSKFERRYGREAKTFINSTRGKALHLRGRYALVIHGGTVRIGDAAAKM